MKVILKINDREYPVNDVDPNVKLAELFDRFFELYQPAKLAGLSSDQDMGFKIAGRVLRSEDFGKTLVELGIFEETRLEATPCKKYSTEVLSPTSLREYVLDPQTVHIPLAKKYLRDYIPIHGEIWGGWSRAHHKARLGWLTPEDVAHYGQLDARLTKDGWSLLHITAYYGHLNSTQLLLEKNANPSITEQSLYGTLSKKTPLHLALQNNHGAVAKALLEAKADPRAVCAKERTPLHEAAQYTTDLQEELMKSLIAKGADVKATDWNGQTILMSLLLSTRATVKNQHLLEWLIDLGVDVDAQDRRGKTALYYACSRNDVASVKTLLSKGADPDISAPMMATESGEIVSLLVEYGAKKPEPELDAKQAQNEKLELEASLALKRETDAKLTGLNKIIQGRKQFLEEDRDKLKILEQMMRESASLDERQLSLKETQKELKPREPAEEAEIILIEPSANIPEAKLPQQKVPTIEPFGEPLSPPFSKTAVWGKRPPSPSESQRKLKTTEQSAEEEITLSERTTEVKSKQEPNKDQSVAPFYKFALWHERTKSLSDAKGRLENLLKTQPEPSEPSSNTIDPKLSNR
ncbi:MAG TPA: ankyrin repeat domain-containing protein [Patescibacteria group bacterium]|nr:ankyrin repeat domain-containing protein [Gammaproteobacteria bacterium]HWA51435.1 ankyrin repeat domain-containing protein [Patescibacteria group bacterium]